MVLSFLLRVVKATGAVKSTCQADGTDNFSSNCRSFAKVQNSSWCTGEEKCSDRRILTPFCSGNSVWTLTRLTASLTWVLGKYHDDVIKWKHFPRYWPFVWRIHRSPVNSPHKGKWRGALMFSPICAWINGWANNREAGDLRRHRTHYDVTVTWNNICIFCLVFETEMRRLFEIRYIFNTMSVDGPATEGAKSSTS